MSLYADDLLIYVRDIRTVPNTIAQILDEFANISGLRVNWAKSCLFPFSPTVQNPILQINGEAVAWQPRMFRYLGIRIYHSSADLFDGNITRTLSSLRGQIQFWKTLPITVAGRVALVKMFMLPRLLYYFANLPLVVPRAFFRLLEVLTRELIWHGTRCRIALAKLYLTTDRRGLAVSNFEYYYLASQMQWIARWMARRQLIDTAMLDRPWTQVSL